MKRILSSAAIATTLIGTTATAAPENYAFDASHSQIVFSYNHLGFTTNWGMFAGFNGDIVFDAEDPAASTVSVSFPVTSMITGWGPRKDHIMSPDFFGADDQEMVSFTSTSIEVTGDNTALITGDLTLNGVTKSVVLNTVLNQAADHPMSSTPTLGISATTMLIRTDYDVGNFAPFVSDEVEVMISLEAQKSE